MVVCNKFGILVASLLRTHKYADKYAICKQVLAEEALI